MTQKRSGPLAGVKIIEMAGIGPGPMCAMLFADMGATVIRVDRATPGDLGLKRPRRFDLLLRNREILGVDLKNPKAVELVLELCGQADAVIEGFRPGVMERLGLGPDVCLARNPRLVFGRMTGWGQTGPLADVAGHDLNYIALTGGLNAIGRRGQPPSVPLNLVGDFGGGALYLAMGVLAAIIEARSSGKGQVVDCAMTEGALSLQTMFFGLRAAGMWSLDRGTNAVDSGSYFYDSYECADGRWVSVAAVEKKFHDELMTHLGFDLAEIGNQMDRDNWPRMKERVAAKFRERTQAEWRELLEHTDSCFGAVMTWDDAPEHPHLKARKAFVEIDGVVQPDAAPRFSRTATAKPTAPKEISSANNTAALQPWLPAERIRALRESGVIA